MEDADLVEKFSQIDESEFPDFYKYNKPLERGLWVLLLAKEELGIKKLTSEQVALIIRDVKEISIDAKSINNAFSRAKDKVYIHHENNDKVLFEIMKPGKDYLISLIKDKSIEIFYFKPGEKYQSKKIVVNQILNNIKGEVKIVDPYCGERTLDIFRHEKKRSIKVLTKLAILNDKDKNSFLRELQDFKSEYPNIEIRDYPYNDIHDRYILSSDSLVILGYSIKDLGNKESFAIMLDRKTSKNIIDSLQEAFNRRWKDSREIKLR